MIVYKVIFSLIFFLPIVVMGIMFFPDKMEMAWLSYVRIIIFLFIISADILFIYFFMPQKFAVSDTSCSMENSYILKHQSVTGSNWYAIGKNKKDSSDVFLEGNKFTKELKLSMVWSRYCVKGFYSNNENKYPEKGLIDAEVKTFHVESWDIIAPITERGTLLGYLFYPRRWLIRSDFEDVKKLKSR